MGAEYRWRNHQRRSPWGRTKWYASHPLRCFGFTILFYCLSRIGRLRVRDISATDTIGLVRQQGRGGDVNKPINGSVNFAKGARYGENLCGGLLGEAAMTRSSSGHRDPTASQ